MPIDKTWQIVLWGHRDQYHTHNHIHYAWHKAFRYLGYRTRWIGENDNIQYIDFRKTLFITEGQVDQNIPLRDDCFYVIHNCKYEKYKDLPHLITNTFITDVESRGGERMDDCIYFDGHCLDLIWATDLLPEEILKNKPTELDLSSKNDYFVGSVSPSTTPFGNSNELLAYQLACNKNGIAFWMLGGFSGDVVSPEANQRLIQNSLYAPTIVGKWQQDVGYIPCRIFKNISYGKWGVTNSPQVWHLFRGQIVLNTDCYQLFYSARERMKTLRLEELHTLMDWVANRHTYLNRIEVLLKCANRRLEGETVAGKG